ncbi:lipoxygenase [Pyrus ussuriensis x Pyrus communis]|uniref:Lipoxygenase n=1 Tax=Pyrus ussuriensis x Pyrus communis TaxID=2448454 RepID=A0A5N5I2I5_9ROSA|nr:lipoxygenase [Pyrus ussuriensis x Pyrus communis]
MVSSKEMGRWMDLLGCVIMNLHAKLGVNLRVLKLGSISQKFPILSKLDPAVYGPPESAITKELLEQEINGMSADKNFSTKRNANHTRQLRRRDYLYLISPGKYAMEVSSAAYKDMWRFDMEALPADVLRSFDWFGLQRSASNLFFLSKLASGRECCLKMTLEAVQGALFRSLFEDFEMYFEFKSCEYIFYNNV